MADDRPPDDPTPSGPSTAAPEPVTTPPPSPKPFPNKIIAGGLKLVPGNGAITQQRLLILERRSKAYDFKLAGMSYRQIGKALGVSQVQALRDVNYERLQRLKEDALTADQKRALLWARGEKATAALWAKVIGGDTEAVKQWRQVAEFQAKLYGVFAPLKIATTTPEGDKWAPMQVVLQSLSREELLVLRKLNDARLIEGEVAEGSGS